MKKLVYIVHPIKDDIENNVKSILKICRIVHEKGHIPFAPYLVTLQYLDDNISEERLLGIDANSEIIKRTIIDEIWLCGSKISDGMKEEIKIALKNEIPIKCYNPQLEKQFHKIKKELSKISH